MGPRFRTLLALSTSILVIAFFSTLAGCGSSGSGSSGSSGSGSTGGTGSGGSGSPTSGSGSSSSVAYAYTSNGTSIFGYAVNADGVLTAVSGSPYAVSTQTTPPEGALVTNGANLYAIANGTDLAIMPLNKSNGSLSQPASSSAIVGDPYTSDLANSLSLDATGQSLYVQAGLSDLDSGINVFAAGSSSTVKQVQFLSSTAIVQSALVFTSNNQSAYTYACSARVEGVFEYIRASAGTLTAVSIPQPTPSVTSPGTNYCPAGIAASATGRLAIAWVPFQYNSSGTVGDQTYVGIYNINSDGSLSLVNNSGVTTASTNAIALNFDPTGSYLAVAGNGGVQVYLLTSGGTLTSAGAPQDAGVSFANVVWDKSNHVFATSSSQLYVFNSSNGVLSSASGSPYTGGPGLVTLPLQ